MKSNIALLIIFTILLGSCGGMKKSKKKSTPAPAVVEEVQAPVEPAKEPEPVIVEVKEKLVEVPDVPVDPHQYFVIIGSFKNVSNARNFQSQIASDGFTAVLLQNEAGLYRVSVKSTNDIAVARDEIRRIRTQFKKYGDTWLLISVK